MRYLSSDEVLSAVAPRVAVEAVREVLKGGFDPTTDPHRQKVALLHGEPHLLPSALDDEVGVKVLEIQNDSVEETVGSLASCKGRLTYAEMAHYGITSINVTTFWRCPSRMCLTRCMVG